MEDLNTSDHLPLSLELMYAPCVGDTDLTSADARHLELTGTGLGEMVT